MGNPQIEQQLGSIIQQLVSDSLKEREIPAVAPLSQSSLYTRLASHPFAAPGPVAPPTHDGFADVEWLAQVLGRSLSATYELVRFGYIPEACIWRTGERKFRVRPHVVLQWRKYGLPGHSAGAVSDA